MTLKKTLMAGAAGAALFALAAPVATTADASDPNSPKNTIKPGKFADLKVYGQVNRAILFFDDGQVSDWREVDGDSSSTRFGFDANAKITESVSIKGKIEMEVESNSTFDQTQNSDADTTTVGDQDNSGGVVGLTERKAQISFVSKQFGMLTLGQQSEVSDGMSDGLDLGGAAFAFAGMDTTLIGASLLFRNDNTAKALSTKTVRGSFSTFDGGRQDGVQYETPKFNGLRAQVGINSAGKEPAVGLLYDNKHGSFKVRVRAFWENASGSGTRGNTWQVGGSVKHDSGISLSALYSTAELDAAGRNDPETIVARIGYTANMNSLGPTGVGFTSIFSNDKQANGDEGTAFGVGALQSISKAGAQLYAHVMWWDVERDAPAAELESIVTAFVGARLQF